MQPGENLTPFAELRIIARQTLLLSIADLLLYLLTSMPMLVTIILTGAASHSIAGNAGPRLWLLFSALW